MRESFGAIVDAGPALVFLARNETTKVLFQGLRGLSPRQELSIAVQRLSNMPMADRLLQGKDLGEVMVIAHASVLASAGCQVTVLIEERAGTELAKGEAARLARMLPRQGAIQVWNTETILLRAIGSPEIPDRATMKTMYDAMRPLDLALPPIEQTALLTSPRWSARS